MEANLIIYDVGSTYTKISAFLRGEKELEFIQRDQVPTTISDIGVGLDNALEKLKKKGLTITEDTQVLSTSSAAGGLRMVAMGYMPRVTAKAAKEVAMSAGARVLEIVTHEDQNEYRIQILREIKPDIILLAGGTDGGDRENILENAQNIVKAKINAVVIIAGNQSAQAQVQQILEKNGISSRRVQNVMPTIHELKVIAAREAIHEQFIRQISMANGLNKLIDRVSNGKVIPTPGAVLLAAELIARGTFRQKGIGDVLIVDIGGATTDIHSILPSLDKMSIEEKGLVVTNEKQSSYRTVEGNLGLRISATGILETVGPMGVLGRIGLQGSTHEKAIAAYTRFLENNPDHISLSSDEQSYDQALAISAIEVALKRHAGYIAQEFNPVMGIVPGTPIGRDLRHVKTVIAVGGIFTHSTETDRCHILDQAMKNKGISLLPESPTCYFDTRYLMYTIGVLSLETPDIALKFAKKYFHIEETNE